MTGGGGMTQDGKLAQIRRRIDAIDGELLRLLSERAACAQQVAEVKQAAGETVFYRPEREAQVLRQVAAANPGPLPHEAVVVVALAPAEEHGPHVPSRRHVPPRPPAASLPK